MKRFLPLVFMAVSFMTSAQATFGHFDRIKLDRIAGDGTCLKVSSQSVPEVTMLMRVSDDATVDRLRAAGAEILQKEGPIVVLSVSADKADNIALTEGVVSVSLSRELEPSEWTSPMGIDRSRSVLGLDKVHSGAQPLSEAYTGKDVIVGVIDRGLDAQHLSFLDKDGNLRVKRVFFTLSNNSSVELKTPAHIKNWKGDVSTGTHGTHVTGIAAGSVLADNGADAPCLTGAAPEADIMLACSQGGLTNDFMLRAARQIADAAKEEGKPCVINISLGNNGGPMDGTDEACVALSEIAAESGAVFCVASGNEGDANATLHATFADDAAVKTFIEASPYTEYVWPSTIGFYARALGNFEIWSEDETPVKVTFELVKISDPATPLSSVTVEGDDAAYVATPNGISSIGVSQKYINITDNYFNTTMTSSFIGGQARVEPSNNRYHVECRTQLQFSSDTNDRTHAVIMKIEGTPGKQVFVYTSTISGLFPMNFSSRNLDGSIAPNGDGTLNAMACAHNIITVGSYNSHSFSKPDGRPGFGENQTSYFSSWAKLIDGRHLPHICAPGMDIVSAMSRYYVNGSSYNAQTEPKYYSRTYNGETYFWTPMTGTSMATPYMTGVAALWLSADNTLTTDDIIRIAQETSSAPDSASENKGAGGNLNAFEGLCKVLGLSSVGNVAVDKADAVTIVPGKGEYKILASGTDHIDISIHDMSGRTVSQQTVQGGRASVCTDGLTPGAYILNVATTYGNKTLKFIQ